MGRLGQFWRLAIIEGIHVDLIFRDIDRVRTVIQQTDLGKTAAHYQTGHPHAYLDVMYRGELASAVTLYAADSAFGALKKRAEHYPPLLKKSLIDFFSFEARFSCMLAGRNEEKGDSYYMAGLLFRSVSALNQALFALNGQWCLNEKKATQRVDSFPLKPENYGSRVNSIFMTIGESPRGSVCILRELCDEVFALCAP